MNILHTVELYWPSVGGAQEVVRQISERLVKRGHKVTVATSEIEGRSKSPVNGVQVEEFRVSGNQVLGFRGDTDRYQDFLSGGGFDVMMNYAAQQWATDLVYPILDRIPYRKVLAPCGFSGLYNRKYKQYFRKLPLQMSLYDHLVFHSHTYRDMQFARQHGLKHFSVIPNAASQEEFETANSTFRQRRAIPENVPILLTVCNHTGSKGHRLVIEAFRKARTGPAVLVIIGKAIGRLSCLPACKLKARIVHATSLGTKRVLLIDAPREEVVAAYRAADLFVLGSRLECSPLVLFEALASKTPFISTNCGNAEEIAAWTGGGFIVPTRRNKDGTVSAQPRVMAGMIETLLGDGEKKRTMAEAGFRSWRERFTWERITDQYEQLYQALTG